MIKGHTEIQLYKDGKMVKNTHDDNMLTNALANYFKNYGMVNPNAFSSDIYNDMITTLLGGVLLLDTALPEQASLTHVPGGVLMVGNGAYGVSNGSDSGDPTEMGSFNAAQSGWADANKTQFRMVWDFTTEQSNGTIACACLTSRAHGFVGEGNATSKIYKSNASYTLDNYSSPIEVRSAHRKCYMDASNYMYTFEGITGDHEIIIYKQRRILNSVDVRTQFDAGDTTPFTTLSVNSSIPIVDLAYMGSDATNIYLGRTYGDDIVLVTTPKTFASATTQVITTGVSGAGDYRWFCDGTNLYAIGGGSGYKYNLSTQTLTAITYDTSITVNTWYSDDGGKIRFSDAVYDKTLNRVVKCNATGVIGNSTDGNIDHSYKDGLYIDSGANSAWYAPLSRRRNDYIASINNLSTPVTKDNTQTMKVIYTLTFTG